MQPSRLGTEKSVRYELYDLLLFSCRSDSTSVSSASHNAGHLLHEEEDRVTSLTTNGQIGIEPIRSGTF
jgi:hypothetical protein